MCGEAYYRSQLALLWVEAVLYGVYAVLFSGCVYTIVSQRRNRYFLLTAVIMFAVSSAQIFVDFARFLLAPSTISGTECVGGVCTSCEAVTEQIAHEADINVLLLSVVDIFMSINHLIADLLLIYRCFIIWGSNIWIVVLPGILLLATTICAGYALSLCIQLYSMMHKARINGNAQLPPRWFSLDRVNSAVITSYIALTLATTLLVTGLIAWKIWHTTREIEDVIGRPKGRQYRSIIAIIIESGAIFAASLIAYLVTSGLFPAGTNDYTSFSVAVMGQLVGLAPILIIIRIGLGRSTEQTYRSAINKSLPPISYPIEFAGINTSQEDLESVITSRRSGSTLQGSVVGENVSGRLSSENC